MKATGMVRPVDTLGRIVIPREIRKMFDIKDGEDHFEIFVSDNQIVLKKYEPCCVFCSEVGDTVIMNDRIVCKNCIEKRQKPQGVGEALRLFVRFVPFVYFYALCALIGFVPA